MKLRTGSIVKSIISNSKAQKMINDAKYYLRRQEYGQAGVLVLQGCLDTIQGRGGDSSAAIILVLCISVLICCCVIPRNKDSFGHDSLNSDAESKLNKIQQITKRNEGKKDFIDKTCVICLEDLPVDHKLNNNKINHLIHEKDVKIEEVHLAVKNCTENIHNDKLDQNKPNIIIINENKPDLMDHQKINNGQHLSAPSDLPGLEEILKHEEKENLLANQATKVDANHLNSSPEFKLAKLDCGHNFHPKCITDWMTNKNNCPVCRSLIDNDNIKEIKPLNQGLVEIQSNIHPELNRYNYNYSGSDFTWFLVANEFARNYHHDNNYGYHGATRNDHYSNYNNYDWNLGGGADGDW
jgi:hypothetical protein